MNAVNGPARPTRAPWSVRLGAVLLSVLLALLIVWLLGFVLADIERIDGPDYDAIRRRHVDAELQARSFELARQIEDLGTRVARHEELQADLRRSMDNARETMQQMMDLHRLSLEQQAPPSDAEKQALATAQQRFLDAQEHYERANAEIAASNETRFQLQQELDATHERIAEQEAPANAEYQRLWERHRLKIASLKLAFIVPLVLAAGWLFRRFRHSAYRPIFVAFLGASFWVLGRVMFEHFPRQFFKYIAIGAALGLVLAFLVWLLRRAVRPSRELLLARHREAYRAHVCPVCAFPIARGPLRYAQWTRQGPRVPPSGESAAAADGASETPYACPSCGTTLYETCRRCQGARHALLPYCEHCGDELLQGPLAEAAPAGP